MSGTSVSGSSKEKPGAQQQCKEKLSSIRKKPWAGPGWGGSSCLGVWKCLYDSGWKYQEEDSFSVFGNQPKLSATWADSLCLPLFQIYQPISDPPHLPSSLPTSLSSLGGGFLPVSTSPLAERERLIRAPLNLHSLPLLCFSLLRFPFSRLLWWLSALVPAVSIAYRQVWVQRWHIPSSLRPVRSELPQRKSLNESPCMMNDIIRRILCQW